MIPPYRQVSGKSGAPEVDWTDIVLNTRFQEYVEHVWSPMPRLDGYTANLKSTYTLFRHVRLRSPFIDFSSRYFMVFNNLSVHAISSVSLAFDVDATEVEEEGMGRM